MLLLHFAAFVWTALHAAAAAAAIDEVGAEAAAPPSSTMRCSGAGIGITVGDDSWSLQFQAAGTSSETIWTVEQPTRGRCELTATVDGSYRLHRQVRETDSGAFGIIETFTNLGGSDLVLWFDNNITSTDEPPGCVQRQWNSHITAVGSSCIDVGGLYNLTHSASFGFMKFYDGKGTGPEYNDPPFNPSVFVRGQAAGLGAVAVDDWMRRQLRIYKLGRSAFFGNHMFGVPAHGSSNYTWTLVPTPSTDYYDFINLARRETVPAYRIAGAGSMVPYDFALGWSNDSLATMLTALAVKTAIITGPMSTGGAPALGDNDFCNLVNFNLTNYLENIGSACTRLKSIQPGLACLAPFETALSPCQLLRPDGAVPPPAWPDSVVITRNGNPAGYDWIYPTPTPGAKILNYIYALHGENSYGMWAAGLLKDALRAGMDGFYFDFFDYAMSENPARQFRYTYNLSLTGWDNRSVDAVGNSSGPRAVARTFSMHDLRNLSFRYLNLPLILGPLMTDMFPGAGKKVDLNWLTTPARAAAIDAALTSGGGLGRFVANGNAAGDSSAIRHRPIVRFWEGCEESSYTSTHLSTAPMSLGWYDGYTKEVLQDNIPKSSDFWRTWDNCTGLACDKNVFEDIKEKLSFGLLYFSYYNPSFSDWSLQRHQTLTLPSLLTHMFPITVRDIRPGTISGDERIITLHSGSYRFTEDHGSSMSDAASQNTTGRLFCYTGGGAAVAAKSVLAASDGTFAVAVPADGACVLELIE